MTAVPRHARPIRSRVWGMPWWLAVSVVFFCGRLATSIILIVYASVQGANPWTPAQPNLFDFSSMWDGRWYDIIAEAGYPPGLRYTDDGHVGESEWAFLPVFPLLVRGVMAITGLPWAVAGVSVSVLAAAATSFVLYRLVLDVTNRPSQALFTVVLFQVSPVSPLQQIAYAESLQWLEVAVALWLLVRRQYAVLMPVIVLLGFTRPGALAFTLTLLLYGIWRWWRRKSDPLGRGETWWITGLTALSLVTGVAWVAIAGIVTGVPTAYLDTELAWRSAYIGYESLVPFTPWIRGIAWWAQNVWGVPAEAVGWLAPVGALLVLALLVGFVFLPATRRVGIVIRAWVLSYGLYLLAVFFPQSSTFRVMGAMFPGLAPLAAPRSVIYRIGIVLVFLTAQVAWVGFCYAIDGQDWTPP